MVTLHSIPKISSISAVFPAYNDYATIPSMVITAILALRQVTDDFEVIVTDDGSQDGTGKVLDEMKERFPELRVFHHPQNMGYGRALRTGFSAATKDWVFYTDGDGQYNPLELIVLVEALKPGVDVVNGYKISRGDTLMRTIIGRIYHHFVKLAFGFQLSDVDCDFRLIRRQLFDLITLESENGTICLEMVKKFQDAGCQFVEVPVHHYPRPHGISQFFHRQHLFETGKGLISLWKKLILHIG
jgi:glycosyltransferase involved in cell wall biosynthesis